jgi:hypothetical protein
MMKTSLGQKFGLLGAAVILFGISRAQVPPENRAHPEFLVAKPIDSAWK